ncbi:HAD domain-containing protein [Paucibacter soli]|uniref:HAD domain-containing protein n=1 Tax=Paucibacter soli TaxID=3133433 RepID=UPI00309EA7FD
MTTLAPGCKAILALDIDGIFHPEGCPPDEEWAHLWRFEEALREVHGVAIVISSARRCGTSLADLKSHFSPDIAARIIGVTPDLYTPGAQYTRGLRQLEIETWMLSNAPGIPWLALDDRKGLFHEDCNSLLLVRHADEGGIGLQHEHLEEMIRRLTIMSTALQAAHNQSQLPTPMSTKKSYVIIIAVSHDGADFVQLVKDKGPAHLIGKRTHPGGGIETFDESPRHAGKREIFEEAGLDIPLASFELVGSDINDARDLHFVFAVADISGANSQESELISVESIDAALSAANGPDAGLYVDDFLDTMAKLMPRINTLRDQAKESKGFDSQSKHGARRSSMRM